MADSRQWYMIAKRMKDMMIMMMSMMAIVGIVITALRKSRGLILLMRLGLLSLIADNDGQWK